MALSQDCRQQHHRERTLSQRWIAVGAIGATGLHLGLLPLIGFDAEALLSRSDDEPIQIIVTSPDTEAVLSPEAALSEAFPSAAAPRAAATPPARERLRPELPQTLDEPEPEEELEPEDIEEPEPEEAVDEPQPEPEEEVVQDPEPEPEPEVAAAPEPTAAPEPEAPTDLADEAETAGAETVEGGGKPEQIAKQPAAGAAPTAPGRDAAVALAPAPEVSDGAGETTPEPTALGGLLEGYFPEGAEEGPLDSAGQGDVARSTGPGDRGDGNASEDSQGDGEGRGNGSRTVRCRSCARPSYPASALADGIEGEAKVSVQFDANGNVIGVTLERSSGNPELDRAALASAEQWRFDTGGQSGSVAVEIPFVIEGSDRHREAQRQGDRESATIPNPGPTAAQGQDRGRATAPDSESNGSGASGQERNQGTTNAGQGDPSDNTDAEANPETTGTSADEAAGSTASGEAAETTPDSGDAEVADPPSGGGTGHATPAPTDPTPAAETAPAAPATPAAPPPATAEPPPVPAAPAAEE